MVKHLKGTDKEKNILASLFFLLNHHSLLPLVVTMFQKYREVCPDKLELLKGWYNVSEMKWEYHFMYLKTPAVPLFDVTIILLLTKFLGRVLVRRNNYTDRRRI